MTSEKVKRKLTAILSADVKGYSRLMGADEVGTIRILQTYRGVISDLIQKKGGRVVDSPGDNVLAEFASVVDALESAVEIQRELKVRNADRSESRRMEFRIGINLGDVVEEGERIYGDGVNIAARIEGLAEGGGICISGTAFDHVGKRLPLGYQYMGEQVVKNIEKPVRVYRVLMEPEQAGKVIGERKGKERRWRWAAAAAVVLVAAALALWNFYFRVPKIEPASKEKMAFALPDEPSIAVLPFVNMSEDSKQEFLSDGITEEIITALSKVRHLFVISRQSTFSYKGKPVKVKQVSEELGVRYVLEGSVQRSADRVRINAQLIDALTGRHIWAERYNRDLLDLFALQDEITMKILSAIRVKLTEGEQVSGYEKWFKGKRGLDCYLKFLEGVNYLQGYSIDGTRMGGRIAQEAIEMCPENPVIYTLMGWVNYLEYWLGLGKSPQESITKGMELIQKALAIDDSLASAHGHLSMFYTLKREHERAIAEAERAVALDPGGAYRHVQYAMSLFYGGRTEEAIPGFQKAIRLNPLGESSNFFNLGGAYRVTGRFEEAVLEYKKALQRAPDSIFAHLGLAATYSMMGREQEARAEAAEVLRISPKFSVDSYAKRLAFKDQSVTNKFSDALRKAGLPDKPPLPLPDKPSIAVLPFVNMSDDKSQEYFCDGMTEEIIGALSKVGNLFVVSRNSSFTYKGKSVDVKQVGREMGVRYVLEGSVRKEENRLRTTAQLIDTTTGDHVFSERYDREMKDVFAVQDDITMKITTAMRVNLTHGEQDRMLAKGTKNLEAYLKILESRKYRETFSRESMAKSRQAAEEAIALDPGYAIAYSSAAGAIGNETWLGVYDNPAVALSRALELAQKGVALDDSLAYPHIALGFIYLVRKDYDKAIAEAERAVALEPSSTDALTQLGVNLFCGGRAEEAIPILQKAVSLSPVPEYRLVQNLANAYRSVGNYEKAIEINQKILQKQPNQMFPHLQLAATFMLMGKEEEAKLHAGEVMRIDPKFSLERYSKTLPWKNREEVDRVIDAAHKAGLK
jgi:adenylate cyclase